MLIRLLLIENDTIMRKISIDSLQEYTILVDEASNGIEGVEKKRSNPYDVILTDINVPGKEGIELLREIKSIPQPIKVISTTKGGDIPPQYLKMSIEFGSDAIIHNPFTEKND